MIVIFALALTVILAIAGLLLDGGMAWSNRRLAQSAADTGAIAAAKSLTTSSSTTAAANAAGAVAGVNGFPTNLLTCSGPPPVANQGVVMTYPPSSGTYAGDPNYVEVTVTRRMLTGFSAAVGQPCWLVSARAVAQTKPAAPTGPALLALDTACGGGGVSTIKWSGSGITIIGDVVSNGGIDWSGSGGGVQVGSAFTYRSPPCGYSPHTNSGLPNQATPTTSIAGDPFTYTTADFHCSNGPTLPSKLQLPATGTAIPDGTYCATTSITIGRFGSTGKVTLIAPEIKISAASVNLTPNENGVLAWATGSAGVNWSGADGIWSGIVYAPLGPIHISGAESSVIQGNLWGLTLELPGSNWTLQAPVSAAGNSAVVKLVE